MGDNIAGFVLGVVLARLLSPAEFGLTGMLAVFFAVSTTFINSGLGSALIQRKHLSDDDTTSCFWLNVTAGLVFAALLCLISPWVADFYGVPVLQPMICVRSASVVFGSLSIVQNSLRARDLDFKTLAIANWSSTLVAGTLGVVMAWRGFGVWSLVAQGVLKSFLMTVLLWMLRPWRPRGTFRWSSIRKLWSFSSRLLAAGLLESVFRNASSVLIGKIYSSVELGLYTRARGFSDSASQSITSIVGRVAFPYFSRLQADRELLKQRLRQFLRLTALVHLPLMTALAVTGPSLVTVLLTEKWLGCVPLLQVLSLVGMMFPLHVYHLQVLTALGRSDLFLRLEVIKKLLIVINLAITAPIGVLAMTWGMLATSLIAYWLNSFYTRRLAGYSWPEQIKDLLPMFLVSSAVGAAGVGAGFVPGQSAWSTLLLQLLAMSAVLGGLLLGLRRTWFADATLLLARFPGCPRWLSRLCLA